MDRCRPLLHRAARAGRRGAVRRARRLDGGRSAGDRRRPEPGQAAPPPRPGAGARTILEIGTLGGYSTIWLARALPADGRLITLEYDPAHADVARSNIARAGLDKLVEVRTGAALDSLPRLEAEGAGPFDLVFIDADKVNNPHYVEWA